MKIVRVLRSHCMHYCMRNMDSILLFFFFQAEDGIRDVAVTGVQTCALPISRGSLAWNQRTCKNFSDFWIIRSWRSALIEKWLSSAQYLRFLCQNGRRFDCSLGPFRLQPGY